MMFIARSSIVLILLGLILQHSYVHSATQDSLFSSSGSLDDTIDPSGNLFTGVHEDGNLYLDDFSGVNTVTSGSDDDLFANFGDTSPDSDRLLLTADSGLVVAYDGCLTPNGKLRKRDGGSCPAEDASLQLTLPTFQESPLLSGPGDDPKGEDDDSQALPSKTAEYDMNRCSAHGILSLLNRVIDVCCDGPRGTWRIDRQTRLIYDWIKACHIGTSTFYYCNQYRIRLH